MNTAAFKRFVISACLVAALLVVIPSSAFARSSDEEDDKTYDGRLLGYEKTVQLDSGSTAFCWVLLVVLGVISMAVLFKDAKRSHLD